MADEGEKTARMTFDLNVDTHRELRRWAAEHDVKLTDVWRALIGRLLTDQQVERKIARDLEGKQIGRHRRPRD